MKGLSLFSRFKFAACGIVTAFKREASFRTQVILGMIAFIATWILRPPAIWVALVVIMVGAVLAAELINTALEHALDGLHPDAAPFIKTAKDCAAAAVLLLSITAVAVFLLLLYHMMGERS